jgi:hypothetical protein
MQINSQTLYIFVAKIKSTLKMHIIMIITQPVTSGMTPIAEKQFEYRQQTVADQ